MVPTLIHSPQATSNLSTSELQIYNATKSPILRTIEPTDKTKIAMEVYLLAKVKLGLNSISSEEEHATVSILLDDLENFNGLTKDEIILATKKGLNGEYLGPKDNQVFFNSSNFVQWVRKYDDNKRSVLSKISNAKQEDEPKPEPDEATKKSQAIQIANMYAEQLHKCKSVGETFKWAGGLNYLYDFAKKYGLLVITEEQRTKLIEKFKGQHTNEAEFIAACKTQAYKDFIISLVDFNARFDENGNYI